MSCLAGSFTAPPLKFLGIHPQVILHWLKKRTRSIATCTAVLGSMRIVNFSTKSKVRLGVVTMEASIFKMAANVQEEKEKLKPTMEMKRRAVNYYNKNNVPKCLESLLNTMFLEEPEDIYGYMVKYHRKTILKGLFCLSKLKCPSSPSIA